MMTGDDPAKVNYAELGITHTSEGSSPVCPAHCITIVPEEAPDGRIEKRPRIFEIDELRCVVCGLCVEACPCDAIRMDTKVHALPTICRADAILDKEALLSRGDQSIATQGGVGAFWREKVKS
jgi:NADH-quinone oxidoreductase subunit I